MMSGATGEGVGSRSQASARRDRAEFTHSGQYLNRVWGASAMTGVAIVC